MAIPTSLLGSFAGDVGFLCRRLQAVRATRVIVRHTAASLVFCSAEFERLYGLQDARFLMAVSASARDLKIASLATVIFGVSVRGILSATVQLLVKEFSTT
jgi:hypothetical protein